MCDVDEMAARLAVGVLWRGGRRHPWTGEEHLDVLEVDAFCRAYRACLLGMNWAVDFGWNIKPQSTSAGQSMG